MLRFCNQHSADVWVCISWYQPGCVDGGDWEKKGWWHMVPGECKVAFGDDVSDVNRFWYYYVESADGRVWAGPFNAEVPPQAFDWCENTSSTQARTVGMRELDVGDNDDYTLNLQTG
jgi:uncharacterized membrane protein